jgi:hypothetical protein
LELVQFRQPLAEGQCHHGRERGRRPGKKAQADTRRGVGTNGDEMKPAWRSGARGTHARCGWRCDCENRADASAGVNL